MEAEVDDATAQLVEHVVGLLATARDVREERGYLEGAVETYVSDLDASRRALDAIHAALARFDRSRIRADIEGAARRRLVTAVQHDGAISVVYRGLICAAIGAIREGFDFDALATEPDEYDGLRDKGIGGTPILYPRVEFERDRTTFKTTVALRHLLSASGWAALNAPTTRAPLPVPPSAIGAGLFEWLRRKGVAALHVGADACVADGERVTWTGAERDAFKHVTGREAAWDETMDELQPDGSSVWRGHSYVDVLYDGGGRRGVLPYMRGVNERAALDAFWRSDDDIVRAQLKLARVYGSEAVHRRGKWRLPR